MIYSCLFWLPTVLCVITRSVFLTVTDNLYSVAKTLAKVGMVSIMEDYLTRLVISVTAR